MEEMVTSPNDELVMKLLRYFISEKNYTPIVIRGVQGEIWLENMEEDYKIVRIVSNYIHNDEQFEFDLFKTKKLMKMKRTDKNLKYYLELTIEKYSSINEVLENNSKSIK